MASIRGFLVGVWRFLDGLRRALQLLVMLAVCVVLVGLLRSAERLITRQLTQRLVHLASRP